MLAFAIAFGLGGRDVAGKIVDDAYKSFKRGRPTGAKRKIQ